MASIERACWKWVRDTFAWETQGSLKALTVGLSEGNRRARTKGMANNLDSHTLEAFKIIYGMTKHINFTLEVIKFSQSHFNLSVEIFRLLSNTWRYKKQGKYAEAEPFYRRRKIVFPPPSYNHRILTTSDNIIGWEKIKMEREIDEVVKEYKGSRNGEGARQQIAETLV
ncbi:uncharacterized protein LOC122953926 isoform X3 [Acropora millepora]|uniref:uncharacterized protein LOC122953926 isoform X3 n=1 Tax=Acropora millepora TaxID=45264 RepID=UPI001CF52B6F|nr:uncharacterized protein LOC122953926 isoform X3 [Acropora millepora]